MSNELDSVWDVAVWERCHGMFETSEENHESVGQRFRAKISTHCLEVCFCCIYAPSGLEIVEDKNYNWPGLFACLVERIWFV